MEMPSSLMPPRKVSSHQQFVNPNLLHKNPVVLYVLVLVHRQEYFWLLALLLILHPTKCAGGCMFSKAVTAQCELDSRLWMT